MPLFLDMTKSSFRQDNQYAKCSLTLSCLHGLAATKKSFV